MPILKFLKQCAVFTIVFIVGSFSTMIYFLYRARTQFIPHMAQISSMPEREVGMLETFEWPLDLFFPGVPILLACIGYLLGFYSYRFFQKVRQKKPF